MENSFRRSLLICFVLLLFMLPLHSALAVPITWVDWTSATSGYPGTASGTANGVTVNYSGEVTWAQTSGGTFYWTEPYAIKPYTGNSVVDNAPGTSDIIVLVGGTGIMNTITFSTAVMDPIMAICSMGAPWEKVYYSFDKSLSFDVLSSGPGYWGGPGTLTELPNNVLEGFEGHGVIQFHGAVSSISWLANPYEYWHGFTIGLPPAKTPEPSTLLLLGSGILGLGFLRKRISR